MAPASRGIGGGVVDPRDVVSRRGGRGHRDSDKSQNPLPADRDGQGDGEDPSLAKSKQGIFAIGPNGHSLYVYSGDHGTKSGCTGGCASSWPAFTESGSITTGVLIKKSEVGKSDGQKPDQVTYYGHLLYYFKGDTAPGDTNGVGITGWHLIGPFGNVMLPRG